MEKSMEFNKETALCEAILFLESEPLTVKVLSNKAQLSEEVVEKCIEKFLTQKQEVKLSVDINPNNMM